MKISIKCTKNIEEYIKIDGGIAGTCYSYIYIDDLAPCMSRDKHTFNKNSFLEWLKSGHVVAKKYIKMVEDYIEQ